MCLLPLWAELEEPILCERTYLQLFEPGQMFYMALPDSEPQSAPNELQTLAASWHCYLGRHIHVVLQKCSSQCQLSRNSWRWKSQSMYLWSLGKWLWRQAEMSHHFWGDPLSSSTDSFPECCHPKGGTGAATSITPEGLSSLMGQEQGWAKDAAACVGAFWLNSLSTGPKWCNWKTKQQNPSWQKWMEASQD